MQMELKFNTIERMPLDERIRFELDHTELHFVLHIDDNNFGLSYTEVLDIDYSFLAVIDISMAAQSIINYDKISIQGANSNININLEGIRISDNEINSVGQDNIHELVANEYNLMVSRHERTPTKYFYYT